MPMTVLPTEDCNSDLAWDFMRHEIAHRVLSLAALGLLYATLLSLGLVLRASSHQLTIIWPAAGLLFIAAVALGLGGQRGSRCPWFRRGGGQRRILVLLAAVVGGEWVGIPAGPCAGTSPNCRSRRRPSVSWCGWAVPYSV